MCSWSLFRPNTNIKRSVEPPASMCSLDQEEVCAKIDNAEITDFNFNRNNTLTCSAIFRSLLVSCPPGTMVSSYTEAHFFLFWLPLVLLSLRTGGSPYSPGFVPVWCLPEQESLGSDEPPGSLLPLLRRFFGAAGSHMHTLSVSHQTGVRQRMRFHHFFHW